MDKYLRANAVFSRFSRSYMELKKELPIRPSEMGVLNIITRRGGQYTPLMIAELLGVSKPMIAAHIRVLLKKGYIVKEPVPEDKRSFYVLPTEKAVKLTDTFSAQQNEYLKKMEGVLGGAGFDELLRLLEQTMPILEREKEKVYAEQ